jgi:hypothetical protein
MSGIVSDGRQMTGDGFEEETRTVTGDRVRATHHPGFFVAVDDIGATHADRRSGSGTGDVHLPQFAAGVFIYVGALFGAGGEAE